MLNSLWGSRLSTTYPKIFTIATRDITILSEHDCLSFLQYNAVYSLCGGCLRLKSLGDFKITFCSLDKDGVAASS